jgi:hypothetical protein
MERIAELRALLADGTITREQITELRALIRTEIAELRAGVLDDTTIAAMNELAADATAAAERDTELAAAEQAIVDEANEVLARIEAALGADPEDPEPETGDDDADAPADQVVETGDLEPVAAATPPVPAVPARPAAPVISRVAARRGPSIAAAAPLVPTPKMSLVAAANVPGITAGTPLDDAEKFTTAFAKAVTAGAGHRGATSNVPVATSHVTYSEEDTLTDDLRGNARKIGARISPTAMAAYRDSLPAEARALLASGGACAPSTVMYDLPTLGGTERPVRDQMLVRFGADRGGVRIMPSPKISDVTAGTGGTASGITTWTAATDATPGGNTKRCLTVTCPSPAETLVDSIVRCLKFGNFQARFFSEQVDAWMNVAAAQWARVAETKLLTAIGAGSTNVSVGQGLGTTRDVLAALDRAAASLRSFYRISRTFPLRFAFPGWLLDNMRADLARELPGSAAERLATADAELFSFFAARNINPSAFLDGESGQVFAQQGAGALLAWPTTVITYLYPEGSWLFLDGGTLDLGVVRDSTLNSTNDFQMFAESFENVAFHGVVSYRLTMDICPSGNTSAAVSFNPCTSGS